MKASDSRRSMRGTSPEVEAAARVLRGSPTPAEKQLWSALRRKAIAGVRFRRQHPLGRFVLDFYAPEHRLAVELDGSAHDTAGDRDARRTDVLEAAGIRVLRFRNEEVIEDTPSVLARIRDALGAPQPPGRD